MVTGSTSNGAYRALVTGASVGGIGSAIVEKLVGSALARELEPRITITATRATPELESFADAQRERGAQVLILAGDLASTTFPVEVARQAIEFAGGLDTLVSNAGNTKLGRLVDQTTLEEWDSVMNVHTRAAWMLASTAYPALRESKGSFIATTSTSGTSPHPGLGAYSPAKAALIRLVETIALEWGPVGIRANAVAPGPIVTPIMLKSRPGVTEDELREMLAARTEAMPLGVLGAPEDIAEAVAFLASPAAKFITGQNLAVDGGLSLTANLRVPMRHQLTVA
ncbi:SDR family NAD(P)-dependent oxidoreductase [Agromyces aerolatus]|uniref:SDR family NAD(P)-dependent oxidoreductase n=1 Tax=Agromyces sp. LY-1074 TaxID=3074080 RepID=UPI00285B6D07|nr:MULTISPECIES: SDR family oxidoreductase [unclassified Agromyces]MDR5699126.1 SDR family oxidoreductase [Agromyces sp. LY-1074]MDR5705095.1 SDR family oxidoreductase [Agromyces sp. LY-1358]